VEVISIEDSRMEGPRGGIRGVVKTPTGVVLSKYQKTGNIGSDPDRADTLHFFWGF
jgi:hypothetical protein